MKQRININLIPNGVAQVVHLSQNDYLNGELEFYLFHGSSVLSDGIANAMIKGLKPDNNIFLYNATSINGNVVTFNVTEQMTAVAGKVDCKLRIQTADGAKHSKAFILDCEADPTTDGNVSESVIDALEELIEQVTEDAAEAQAAAESAEEDADRAEAAADNLVTYITRTGNPVVADKALAQPLEKYVAHIEPEQDLNGYGRPWADGFGKNLLPVTGATATSGGITYTYNDDGTVTATGTATGNTTSNYGYVTLPAGTYLVSGCTGGSSAKYRIRLSKNSWTGDVVAQNYDDDTEFTLEEATDVYARLYVGVAAGENVNITFKPMVRRVSEIDPTYEPYSNICPISGYSSLTVTRTGKNLLTNNMQSVTKNGITMTRNTDGSFTFNGTATANIGFYISAANSSTQTVLPIKPGTYTLSGGASGGTGTTYRLAVYIYVNGTYTRAYSDFGSSRTFTISEDENGYIPLINIYNGTTVSNLTFKPQLEIGDTATEYESYNGATYSVTFPAGAGTVYGGTLSVNDDGSGTLTVDRGCFTAEEFLNHAKGSATSIDEFFFRAKAGQEPAVTSLANTDIICSHAVHWNNGSGYSVRCRMGSGQPRIVFPVGTMQTNADFNTWLDEQVTAGTPLQFSYILATPTTYALSAVQVIQMLEGADVIWNDVKGDQEVTYWHNSALNTLAQNIVDMQEAIDDMGDTIDDLSAEVVRKEDITQSGTVTTAGQYAVDARQLNPTISGTIAKRVTDLEDGVVLKSALSRSTSVASTKQYAVDAYELNAAKSGTLAKKISDNTTALGGFKFGMTSDTPPKPGYIVPGADTVIPFSDGSIDNLTSTEFVITYNISDPSSGYEQTFTRTVGGTIVAAGITQLSATASRGGNPVVTFEDDTMTLKAHYTYSENATATVTVWYIPE